VPRVGVPSDPTDRRLETINSCATGCTEFSPRLCAICQDFAKRFKITGHEGLGSTNHIVAKIFCEPPTGCVGIAVIGSLLSMARPLIVMPWSTASFRAFVTLAPPHQLPCRRHPFGDQLWRPLPAFVRFPDIPCVVEFFAPRGFRLVILVHALPPPGGPFLSAPTLEVLLTEWNSPSPNHPNYVRLSHQLLIVLAPRGSPGLWRQQALRLGQDHPRKAPPVTHPAAVDVILEVIAVADGKIECALLGEAIEPSVILRRQVVVGKVV
jgi:hypothetical protein